MRRWRQAIPCLSAIVIVVLALLDDASAQQAAESVRRMVSAMREHGVGALGPVTEAGRGRRLCCPATVFA